MSGVWSLHSSPRSLFDLLAYASTRLRRPSRSIFPSSLYALLLQSIPPLAQLVTPKPASFLHPSPTDILPHVPTLSLSRRNYSPQPRLCASKWPWCEPVLPSASRCSR